MKELYSIIFKLCSLGCRQLPAHSFFWRGYQLPLCARCLGVLVGAGLLVGFFFARKRLLLPKLVPSSVLCLPLIIDGLAHTSNVTPWPNQVRFLTGVFFALGAVNFTLLCIGWLEPHVALMDDVPAESRKEDKGPLRRICLLVSGSGQNPRKVARRDSSGPEERRGHTRTGPQPRGLRPLLNRGVRCSHAK